MRTKFEIHMKKLWELSGQIGTKGETDERYAAVYAKLSDALDEAERTGLIVNEEVDNEN